MVGVLIQVLSVLIGVVANFMIPLVYGVEAYGFFIQANILAYVFHRFSDISSESLIAARLHGSIFVQALLFNIIYILVFSALNYFFDIGNLLFLSSLLLSSTVLLTLYSQHKTKIILFFLFVTASVFLSMIFLVSIKKVKIDITHLMIFSTLPPAVFGFFYLLFLNKNEFFKKASYRSLIEAIRLLPHIVSLTLVFNFLTNFMPYIATKLLLPREIGMLRIILSLIQAAASLFPLNIKHIFSSLIRSQDREHFYYVLMKISLVYFVLMEIIAWVTSYFYLSILPYVMLLSILPVFWGSMLSERYLQAQGKQFVLVSVNLAFSVIIAISATLCTSLELFIALYITSVVGYASILLCFVKPILPLEIYIVGPLSMLQVYLLRFSILWGVIISIIMLSIFIFRNPDVINDLRFIKKEMY